MEEDDWVVVGEQTQRKYCIMEGGDRLIETLNNMTEVDVVILQKQYLIHMD